MDERQHINLLDHFAKDALKDVKEAYEAKFEEYRALKQEVAKLSLDEQRTAQKIDLYQFQIKELEQAKLKADV